MINETPIARLPPAHSPSPRTTSIMAATINTAPAQLHRTQSTTPLFSPSLISPKVSTSLPDNYVVRPLQRTDYHQGFLDVLRVLTDVGDITEEAFTERYDWMCEKGAGQYFLLVICDEHDKVVGTGALIVERKL
ncbi:MAG: Glucosamine-phosphate N-acetyltransferase-like protein [Trizodia sp. TS-e1964]|nr:MAG: Glucosamine-phosphate N-acetyltransferase-like protein [Trizodia sp. TS-e1964]